MPGTFEQSVYCQNVQPWPPQLPAGRRGSDADVQCAIQSRLPACANTGVSPSDVFQKLGDA